MQNECPICGKRKVLKHKVYDRLVCSRQCAEVVYGRKRVHYKRDLFGRVNKPPSGKIKCLQCEKIFTATNYNQKFCSIYCCDNWCYHHTKKHKRIKERKLKTDILNRAIKVCSLCGTKNKDIFPPIEFEVKWQTKNVKFHKDHIQPKINGGENIDKNYRYVCWFCNMTRKNLDKKYDEAIANAGKAFWRTIKKLKFL